MRRSDSCEFCFTFSPRRATWISIKLRGTWFESCKHFWLFFCFCFILTSRFHFTCTMRVFYPLLLLLMWRRKMTTVSIMALQRWPIQNVIDIEKWITIRRIQSFNFKWLQQLEIALSISMMIQYTCYFVLQQIGNEKKIGSEILFLCHLKLFLQNLCQLHIIIIFFFFLSTAYKCSHTFFQFISIYKIRTTLRRREQLPCS